jgi:hypothetical protein
MKRITGYLVVLFLVMGALAFVFGSNAVSGADRTGSGEAIMDAEERASNLLVNGNMEELPFYWKYPNHFVAGGWLRWWIHGDIPEYDDVRSWRPQRYDGEHAQIYFWYGTSYTAGIYQRVTGVQPCTYYQFDMYGRNHSNAGAEHNARLGIDPLGRTYNDIDNPGISSFPSGIVWSPRKTYYEVWGLHRVRAESRASSITAITYASPEEGYGYYDTFWDAGSLYQVDPPWGKLPDPDDWTPSSFIQNVYTNTVGNDLYIEWDTTSAASTQVWYDLYSLSPPTITVPTSYTVYLPLVSQDIQWRYSTPVDQTPITHHEVVIENMGGMGVRFVALSRRLDGTVCRTEASDVFIVEVPETVVGRSDQE